MSRPTDIRARDIESGSGGARPGESRGLDRVLPEPGLFYGGGGMDSNGLWLRLYTDFYRNGKVRTLSESLQIRFVWVLCLHKEGKLVGRSMEEIAWDLRIPVEEADDAIHSMISADLLLPDLTPVGWEDRQYQSDSSTERVRKHREKLRERSGNVTETVQSRVEQSRVDADESREGPLSRKRDDAPPACQNIIHHLNTKTGKKFATSGPRAAASTDLIKARLKQGFTEAECIAVIDAKVREWTGTDYEKFLRPATLFARKNFEQYVGSIGSSQPSLPPLFVEEHVDAQQR